MTGKLFRSSAECLEIAITAIAISVAVLALVIALA